MTFPGQATATATATAVALAVLIVVTAILWWVKVALPGALHHPVFFYLVPTAVLALVYGVIDGALFAVATFVCSTFFLYDPIYSFACPVSMRSANSSGSPSSPWSALSAWWSCAAIRENLISIIGVPFGVCRGAKFN